MKWNDHVLHPLQTWEWGEFRSAMGVDLTRAENFQLTFHKLPHLPFTVGYFPKGPAPTPEMLHTLKKLGKEKNAIYIQLEPNVLNSQPITHNSQLIPSHHPLFTKYTFVLDLTKSEETLLKDMHSKTRYNLKVAQKHGVHVEQNNSPQAFLEYLRLNHETTKRQGFYAHTIKYHQTMWNILHQAGIAQLWTATYNNEILAAWVIFCFKDTIYYPYGASSRNHREVMAPNLLLWEIAKWGKQKGYKKFDLWGAMGPTPDKNDPWYGFHRFKEGFNPDLIEFIGSYDLVLQPLLYKVYCLADIIRWKLLKLRQ